MLNNKTKKAPFYIVANWKMNGDRDSFLGFINKLSNVISDKNTLTQVVLCPPFIALNILPSFDSKIMIGGQNCYHEKSGAFTGEISADMLKSCGCQYVILGHYERRSFFHETNNQVKMKAKSAIESNLTPIICIGESYESRLNGRFYDELLTQCSQSIPFLFLKKCIIAYEPVWAIGGKHLPSLDLIEDSVNIIRSFFQGEDLKIIYGGAVKQDNIRDILKIKLLSGVLVGSASLDFNSFYDIIKTIENILQESPLCR